MTRKYKYTGVKMNLSPVVELHQIEALRDISRHNVRKGDIGGWIQFERNLSHKGDAWVADNAKVAGSLTEVTGDALIADNAFVNIRCKVSGENMVTGNAVITKTELFGNQNFINDDARVTDVTIQGRDIIISGKAKVENVLFSESAKNINIAGNAVFKNDWKMLVVTGDTITITGNALVLDLEAMQGRLITLIRDCVLKDGVSLNGKSINITDACSLEGKIIVGDNVSLLECVTLYHTGNDSVSLDSVELHGDIYQEAKVVQKIKQT